MRIDEIAQYFQTEENFATVFLIRADQLFLFSLLGCSVLSL